ncbi:hypothetical protein [Lederbergia graminis]|uniref:NADH dehydrogenase subunit 6 n=1 Tax=Lederbergia graminis TaxID=735518 RepID=A0ABW0LFK8_9BACI|nr:hypothetical protein [Paenibacillus bovis]HLU24063.1 hypothetical protein [Bacillaceae bacterium]
MNLLNGTDSLYLTVVLAAYAILGLTLIPATAALLSSFLVALQIIAIIVIVLFAGAVIIRGLLKLFGSFR